MQNIKELLKTNKKNIIKGYCSIAFTDILINEKGEIFCCGCEGWVKKSVGNILYCNSIEEFEKLLDNNSEFKTSILDKSYQYCNGFKCFYLQQNINNVVFPFEKSQEFVKKQQLQRIYLQIDESCNLYCTSCRSSKILHKNNEKTKIVKQILENISNFILPNYNHLEVRLVGNGEIFASNEILPWFLNFDFNKFNNVKFFIHSNGTLLHKHEKFLNSIVNNLYGFEISIDAATENTYKKTRLGGNWEHLLRGLDIVKKLQEKNNKISFNLSFVVSNENYQEMEKFIIFANNFNCKIIFYKILQWSMNKEKFDNLNIFSPKHVEHTKFKQILQTIKNYKFDSNFSYFINDF